MLLNYYHKVLHMQLKYSYKFSLGKKFMDLISDYLDKSIWYKMSNFKVISPYHKPKAFPLVVPC